MAQEPISVLFLEPMSDGSRELSEILGKSRAIEVMPVPSVAEALQATQQFLPCVLVVTTHNEIDAAEQLGMLKKLEKPVKTGHLKVMVLSALKNHPRAPDFAELGIQDYAEEPAPARALMFKMNLALKAVLAARKKDEQAKKADEKIVFKATEKEKAHEVKIDAMKGEVAAKYKPALQLGEDIFVFKQGNPRKVGKKFILQAEGPLPETGEWKQEPAKKGKKGEQQWRWIPKRAPDEPPPENEDDGWIHNGEMPTFNEKTGQWQLRSERPELAFRKKGEIVGKKVETDENGQVIVAEDSRTAIDNIMANKTLAKMRREEVVKRAFESKKKPEEDEEEKRKAERKTEEEENAERKLGGAQGDAEEEAAFRDRQEEGDDEEPSLRKRKAREKKKEEEEEPEKELVGSGEDGEEEGAEWRASKKAKKPAEEEAPELSAEAREEQKRKKREGFAKEPEEEKEKRTRAPLEAKEEEEREIRRLKGKKPGSPEEEDLEAEAQEKEPAEEDQAGIEDVAGSEEEKAEKKRRLAKAREKKEKEAVDRENLEKSPEEEDVRQGALKRREAKVKERALKRIEELKKEVAEEEARAAEVPASEEEVRKLRHELGVPENEPVEPRQLAERRKREKVRALKKAVADLEDSIEGKGPPLEALFPEEEPEWNELEDSGEKKKRNFRAIESIDEEAQDGFFGSEKNGKKREKKEKSGPEAPQEYFLEQREVQPPDGAWEEERGFRIYLPLSVFEEGIRSLDQVLPAWFHEGEFEPELLAEEGKWKFLENEPRRASELSELPKPLRHLLENLLDQGALAQGLDPEVVRAEARKKRTLAAKGAKEKPEEESALELPDSLENESKAKPKLPWLEQREQEKAALGSGEAQDALGVDLPEGEEKEERKRRREFKGGNLDVSVEEEDGEEKKKRKREARGARDGEDKDRGEAGELDFGEESKAEKSSRAEKDADRVSIDEDLRPERERKEMVLGEEFSRKGDAAEEVDLGAGALRLLAREALALSLMNDLASRSVGRPGDLLVAVRALARAFPGWEFAPEASAGFELPLPGGFYARSPSGRMPAREAEIFKLFRLVLSRLRARQAGAIEPGKAA